MKDFAQILDTPVFRTVGEVAESLGMECYVVGGYVRDLILERPSTDIDFVVVGSGIEVATLCARRLGRHASVTVFRNFGTAQVRTHGMELEFVGARKESYQRNSRKPIVEDGTLEDDISRRDFTVNAMAVSVNPSTFGRLVDLYNGAADMQSRILRTPLDPDITFSDDPLRMMRAIRFATQLDFSILPETFNAIARNASRLRIVSGERIAVELRKIMATPRPSTGWKLLLQSGLLDIILPELKAMQGVETVKGRGHKDNFLHTMQVLDNVAAVSDNEWLRWAALLHDIAKPVTKKWDDSTGWTFHNHNFIGSKMVPRLFKRLKLPLDEKMKYVAKLVELHMRPIALVEDSVTDSAVRRLLVDAGDDIEDLMTLCRADITSKNPEKVQRHLQNFEAVKQKMADIEARDALRNYQPPVDGHMIMRTFGLTQSPLVGIIKTHIRESLLNSDTPNDLTLAMNLMYDKARELGLEPLDKPL